MHRALALAAGLFLITPIVCAAPGSHPVPPAVATTVWLCNLSEEATRLHCVADGDPQDGAMPAAQAGPSAGGGAAATAVVGGTRFPLDRRQRWTVELWSPFSGEPDWLRLLARATLCYRSPGCEAIVHLPAEFRPAALRSR